MSDAGGSDGGLGSNRPPQRGKSLRDRAAASRARIVERKEDRGGAVPGRTPVRPPISPSIQVPSPPAGTNSTTGTTSADSSFRRPSPGKSPTGLLFLARPSAVGTKTLLGQ